MHIPDADSFRSVDRTCLGLKEFATREAHGLVWIHPTADRSPNIDEYLSGLGPELDGYDTGAFHLYATRRVEQPFNWKIAIDTFLEPYHFAILHRTTVAPIFVHNVCLFEPFGHHLREVLPRHTVHDMHQRPESEWDLIPHTAVVYVLFPNTVLVAQLDHLEIWRINPLAVDRCEITMGLLTPEPAETDAARRHWARNVDLVMKTVLEEDFVVGAGIQSGLAAGGLAEVTFGRNEPALAHFERQVAAALAA